MRTVPFTCLHCGGHPVGFTTLGVLFVFTDVVLGVICFIFVGKAGMNTTFLVGLVYASLMVLYLVSRLHNFHCALSHSLVGQVFHCSFPVLVLNVTNVLGRIISGVVFPFICPSPMRTSIRLNVCKTADGVTVVVTVFARTFHFTCRPFIFNGDGRGSGQRVCTRTVGFFVVFALLTFLAIVFCLSVLHCIVKHSC